MSARASFENAFLAIAIDDACADIHDAWRSGRAPVSLALGSTLYAQVLAAREREVLTGAPLLLLDLPVFEDPSLNGSSVHLVTAEEGR
jgi:hypothetical protein